MMGSSSRESDSQTAKGSSIYDGHREIKVFNLLSPHPACPPEPDPSLPLWASTYVHNRHKQRIALLRQCNDLPGLKLNCNYNTIVV